MPLRERKADVSDPVRDRMREELIAALGNCIWGDPGGRAIYPQLGGAFLLALDAYVDERWAQKTSGPLPPLDAETKRRAWEGARALIAEQGEDIDELVDKAAAKLPANLGRVSPEDRGAGVFTEPLRELAAALGMGEGRHSANSVVRAAIERLADAEAKVEDARRIAHDALDVWLHCGEAKP